MPSLQGPPLPMALELYLLTSKSLLPAPYKQQLHYNCTLFHFLSPYFPALWAGSRAGSPVSGQAKTKNWSLVGISCSAFLVG